MSNLDSYLRAAMERALKVQVMLQTGMRNSSRGINPKHLYKLSHLS